jgi:aspartate aminotransferase
MKGATVLISNPTWGNHRNIFGDEGVEWKYYRWVAAGVHQRVLVGLV